MLTISRQKQVQCRENFRLIPFPCSKLHNMNILILPQFSSPIDSLVTQNNYSSKSTDTRNQIGKIKWGKH